jgi:tetratricopeptide (TPR) repeat protein
VAEHFDQEQQSRAFLAHLEPKDSKILLHVLDCPSCQGLARSLPRQPRESFEVELPRAGTRAALERRAPGAESVRRLDRVLAASPAGRSELLRQAEFRDLDLADLLLEKAEAAQPRDLEVSEEMARLAFATAEPMVQDRWVARANDAKARACVLVGNVRRLERDTEGADEMFSKAVFHLTGPPNCRQRAFYCRNLALLREDQGQVDEAVGLLWRAAMIDRENGELRDEGRGLARIGFLFLEEEQVERAVPPLTQASRALQLPADADLHARCVLALAYCHASLGDHEKSQRFLLAAHTLVPGLPAGESKARALWFEGKVVALTGALEDAVRFFDGARQYFLSAGNLHAAVRVSMDLVRVLSRLGWEERFDGLLSELGAVQPVTLEKMGLQFAMSAFVAAARRKEDLAEALTVAISRLRCCRRDPILILGYWPPELNGSVKLDGNTFDPSLTTAKPLGLPLLNCSSGTMIAPDVSTGDAVWKLSRWFRTRPV